MSLSSAEYSPQNQHLAVSQTINLPMLTPRHYQIPLWNYLDGGGKRAVIVWHRRAGKDLLCWNYVVTEACTGRVGGYTYYFPNAALAKKIIWNGADKAGKRFLDYIPPRLVKRINRQEMLIEFYNGSILQLAGTDKSINVGTNPVGTIFSEFSLQNLVRGIIYGRYWQKTTGGRSSMVLHVVVITSLIYTKWRETTPLGSAKLSQ